MQDLEVIPDKNCDESTFPFTSETCNLHACGEDEIIPVNTTQTVEDYTTTEATEADVGKITSYSN